MAFSVFVFCRMGLMGQGVAAAPLPPRTVDAAPSKGPRSFSRGTGPAQRGKFIRDRSYSTTKGRARSRPILARGGKERGKSRADRFWYGQSLVQEGSFPVSKQRCPSKKHRLPAGQPPSGHRGDVVREGGCQSQSIKSAKMALLTRKPRGVRQ